TGNVIAVNEIAATNIAWRVDVHYRTCASGQVPCADGSIFQTAPLMFWLAPGQPAPAPKGAADGAAAAQLFAFAAPTGTAAAAAVPPPPTIPTEQPHLLRHLSSPAAAAPPGS